MPTRLLLSISLFLAAWMVQPLDLDPPFGGTIFLDPDIITEQDPTAFSGAVFLGQGTRTMFDRRVNSWISAHAWLVQADFDDGLSVEVQVNPEFASSTEAMEEAIKWATAAGRLPTSLRTNVQTMWIHKGTQPFGGGNNNLLIHTGQGQLYINDGILEETLVHEATHTSIDPLIVGDASWQAAQQADPDFISTYARDFPDREDMAETLLTWLAVRHRSDRISTSLKQTIEETIPNRLAWLDEQNFNLYPLSAATNAEPDPTLPDDLTLLPSYPNPFHDTVRIPFRLTAPTGIQIDILNTLGVRVVTVVDESLSAGFHEVTWTGVDARGSAMPSGVYFIRLQTEDVLSARKIVLINN